MALLQFNSAPMYIILDEALALLAHASAAHSSSRSLSKGLFMNANVLFRMRFHDGIVERTAQRNTALLLHNAEREQEEDAPGEAMTVAWSCATEGTAKSHIRDAA
ncbi:hypothetical protein F5148DRAFT_486851 [Russula earlei]|uniref:Uncharacterized protein n=1 Tax=Russula earlei TaxID=71964 RepID=A0ACC0TZ03_9AGAM|nr:hypothetical protein F5148DRAFT_486851 [Russula earlei]